MLLKSLGKSRRNQVATVFMRKSIWIVKATWKTRQIKQASRAGWSSERCGIHVSTSPSNESGENIFSDIVSESAGWYENINLYSSFFVRQLFD